MTPLNWIRNWKENCTCKILGEGKVFTASLDGKKWEEKIISEVKEKHFLLFEV